jgi:hypothetical protein
MYKKMLVPVDNSHRSARPMFGSVAGQVPRESDVPALLITAALSVGPDERQIATVETKIVATAG